MTREQRSSWARHHGEGRYPAASEWWGQKGLAAGRAPSDLGGDLAVRREAEEMDPALGPVSRYRSLLVPVDGSPFGEHALPVALGIARRTGAKVRLVHVHCPLRPTYPPGAPEYGSGLDTLLRRRQQAYLDDLLRRLAKVSSVAVTPVFLQGWDVAVSLCEAAGAATDLVVMATHGRGPLGRLWWGSVADALVRRLSVPLLLVRGYDAPADLTGDPLMRHVLIPLDGSKHAEQVLEPALTLGTLRGAYHTLLGVLPVAAGSVAARGGLPRRLPGKRRLEEARRYLLGVAERLEGRGIRAHPRLVLDEQSTARAILHHARTHDVDLIALATRGRGGLARLFRGSVADRVVRGATVPVLLARAGGAGGDQTARW